MKKTSILAALFLVFGLMAGSSFAQIDYCQDFLEPGNPGGRTTGLKTCDTVNPITITAGDTFAIDIWASDLPESIISGGFEMTFNASQLSIVSVQAYDNVDIAGGPWDGSGTFKIPEPAGPGSYILGLVQLSCAVPDTGGDVIIAKVTFQCLAAGSSGISVKGITDFDTTVGCASGTNYDPQMGTGTITITQGGGCTPGGPCDDGNACTQNEIYDANCNCTGGTDRVCNDSNVCTTDSCSPATGCVFTNNTVACDDGLFCNGTDTCSGGSCSSHAGDPCTGGAVCNNICNEAANNCLAPNGTGCTSDGNPCTNDICNGSGACTHPNNTASCNDGDACTANDVCAGGACGGTPIDCDDGNPNTIDSCDPATGQCINTPPGCTEPCSDNNACTGNDACVGDVCTGTPVDCDDADLCTTDSCSPASGCVNTPVDCDDGNPNTTDSCDPATGQCINTPLGCIEPCSDNNACTGNDACVGDVCTGTPIDCDDANPCTTDSCNPATGCVHTPVVCNDDNRCTIDTCNPASGQCTSSPVNCDDTVACTGDSCDPSSGTCVHTPVDENCQDNGLFCDGNEVCDQINGCISEGDPCSAGFQCNEDTASCDPVSGITVSVDIDPYACPNPVNLESTGKVRVSILGTDTLDITLIDQATVRLSREGVPGAVAPVVFDYMDRSTPFEGGLCACSDCGKKDPVYTDSTGLPTGGGDPSKDICGTDGHVDMSAYFKISQLVAVLRLDEVAGQTIPLTLTAKLLNGTDLVGKDCILVQGDCKGDFDCDGDVDGKDTHSIKTKFGWSASDGPAADAGTSSGDFDDDGDIDATDINGFITIFGSQYEGPCAFVECNGDFDCDQDVDGTDAKKFGTNFGRNRYHNPCTDDNPCVSDFDADSDCDGSDAAAFKGDFGRGMLRSPCRGCVIQ